MTHLQEVCLDILTREGFRTTRGRKFFANVLVVRSPEPELPLRVLRQHIHGIGSRVTSAPGGRGYVLLTFPKEQA